MLKSHWPPRKRWRNVARKSRSIAAARVIAATKEEGRIKIRTRKLITAKMYASRYGRRWRNTTRNRQADIDTKQIIAATEEGRGMR